MAADWALLPEQVIAQFDLDWHPTCRCGMCDLFLWGHLKGNVYKEKPNTLEELKVAVQNQPASNNSN